LYFNGELNRFHSIARYSVIIKNFPKLTFTFLEEPEDLTAINYLKKIYDMADTVDSTLRTITPEIEWRKEIHEEIGKKLEMPREWFEGMHAVAYPHDKHGRLIVTEEALNVQVELLLAKTLLVYERLNQFYK
jgi:predicted RNA-binding protein with EMAP domain